MNSRPHLNRRRRVASLATLAVLAVGVPIAVFLSPADAGSTTKCTAWKTKIERTGLDPNYATAECTSIGANTKVRAKLDVNLDADRHSKWFKRTNREFSTPTIMCVWGCSATYETGKR